MVPGEYLLASDPIQANAERETIVATHRMLDDAPARVQAAHGAIDKLVDLAKQAAGEGDVYLDGGHLIRQALDAGLIDELVLTVVPVVLGAGHPLFAGAEQRHDLELVAERACAGGLVQLSYRPVG